jgi:hypothetical protein
MKMPQEEKGLVLCPTHERQGIHGDEHAQKAPKVDRSEI